jgi:cytochrome c biogenesis protein ResB
MTTTSDDTPVTSNRGKSRMPLDRTAQEQIKVLVAKFIAYRPGDSFFIAGVQPADVEFMRRPALAAGVGITIRRVEMDEIYQQAGVRIWREAGAYDDL